MKVLQEGNTQLLDGMTLKNRWNNKLILTEIFPSLHETWYLKVLWKYFFFFSLLCILPFYIQLQVILNMHNNHLFMYRWGRSLTIYHQHWPICVVMQSRVRWNKVNTSQTTRRWVLQIIYLAVSRFTLGATYDYERKFASSMDLLPHH